MVIKTPAPTFANLARDLRTFDLDGPLDTATLRELSSRARSLGYGYYSDRIDDQIKDPQGAAHCGRAVKSLATAVRDDNSRYVVPFERAYKAYRRVTVEALLDLSTSPRRRPTTADKAAVEACRVDEMTGLAAWEIATIPGLKLAA